MVQLTIIVTSKANSEIVAGSMAGEYISLVVLTVVEIRVMFKSGKFTVDLLGSYFHSQTSGKVEEKKCDYS